MIEALAVITLAILVVAVYMIGYSNGITRGHKLIRDAIGFHTEIASKSYDKGQESMSGWRTEAELQRKNVNRLQNLINRELKAKKDKRKQ